MNVISVEIKYPSLLPSPLSIPPRTPTPILRSHSFASNQVASQKGIVGYYDINELSEELQRFGISEETRTALLRERNQATRRSTITRDEEHTNRNPSSKSRVPKSRHSGAARDCYVDFSNSFHDAVRAQSVKIATKDSAPIVHPNVCQRGIPQTPEGRKHKKKRTCMAEPVEIREGLLIVANGKVVDFRKDVKRSAKRHENERKRLRAEMRKQMHIVRSFDDTLEKYDATKMQIEQTKSM